MTAIGHSGDGRTSQVGAVRPGAAGSPAIQSAGRPGAPSWLRRPAVQGLLALACYAAIWLSTSGRYLIGHASMAQLDQMSMDPNFYVWAMRWWPFAIAHGLNPAFTHYVGAPAGYSLAWVTTVGPLALLASPITVAAGPVVAFNLVTAVGLPLAAWAAFVLCRRLTGKFWPSLVGGAVFGFSAYEMNHDVAGQLNLTYSLLLPILAYLVVVWRDRGIGDRTFVILAGLLMAVQFYLFLETFADLTALLAVSLLLGLAVAGRAGRPQVLRLTRLVAFGYAIAIVLAAPYLIYAFRTPSPKLVAATGMDLASLVVPRPQRTFDIGWLRHLAWGPIHASQACYLGIPLLVLAILFAVTRWSGRLVRFLTYLLVVIIVAALGGAVYVAGHRLFTMPWSGLFSLPIVRNAYPLRLMVFAYLALAVVTALWLAGRGGLRGRVGVASSDGLAAMDGLAGGDGLARGAGLAGQDVTARPGWHTWGRWLLAALVIVGIALDTPPMPADGHTTVPTFISTGVYQRQLSRGEIVVVVSKIGNAGMLWQAESDFYWRLAGGYVNQAITRRSDLPKQVQDLAHATPASVLAFEAYIRTNHIGAILVAAQSEPQWVGIFWRMGLKGHRIDNVEVYPTDGCRSCRVLRPSDLY
jgi:hypothetical protein